MSVGAYLNLMSLDTVWTAIFAVFRFILEVLSLALLAFHGIG